MQESDGPYIPSSPWRAPTIGAIEKLVAEEEGSIFMGLAGEEILTSQVQYTIFDPQHTYYDSKIFIELNLATDEAPKSLVAFKAFRLALHLLIVHVSTKLELQNEEELREAVTNIYTGYEFLRDFFELNKEFDNQRKVINKKLEPLVKKILSDLTQLMPIQGYETIECNAILDAAKRVKVENVNKLGKRIPHFNREAAVLLLATDTLHQQHIQNVLEPMLEKNVTQYAERKRIKLIKLINPNEMCEFMITGGQASGKGTSVNQIRYEAYIKGISWKQIVKINTDSYKPLLLNPTNVREDLYSQLAQEEASLIHALVQKKIASLIEEGHGVHHLFVDQVFVDEIKIGLALKARGNVFVTIVSTEAADSVKRAYDRGIEEGRFENTRGILSCHQKMTANAMVSLSKFAGENVLAKVVDNNVPKGHQPILVMSINLKEKKAEIHDMKLFERFIKKTTINTNATSEENLYQGEVNIEKYLEPLKHVEVLIQLPATQEETPVVETSPRGLRH